MKENHIRKVRKSEERKVKNIGKNRNKATAFEMSEDFIPQKVDPCSPMSLRLLPYVCIHFKNIPLHVFA